MINEPETPKRSLSDVGTRWEHWSELLDIWESGYEVVCNSLKRFANDTDAARKKSLEQAIFLLRRQIEQLADYNKGMVKLRDEINKIPPTGWNKKPASRLMIDKIEEESKGDV